MLRLTCIMWRKRPLPLGLSKRQFAKKVRNPGARKPWMDPKAASAGIVEMESIHDYYGNPTMEVYHGDEEPDTETLRIPSSLRSSTSDIRSIHPSVGEDHSNFIEGENETKFPLVFAHEAPAIDEAAPSSGGDVPVSISGCTVSSVQMGDQLKMEVRNASPADASHEFRKGDIAPGESPVAPMKLESFRRSRREAAETVALPRHINKLFHKIMGWSNEAVQVDESHPLISDAQMKEDPLLPQKAYSSMKQKIQYGLLMEDFEKDRFAIENQLTIAGKNFEKKFLEWEGLRILDKDAAKAFEDVKANKGSLVIDTPNTFRVPVVNHDPCPGCGATLQDKDENSFGFVRRGQIEGYIEDESNTVRARTEYADRMAELQRHWEKHGRRVGEEWLDFMTQEEFDAIYRHKSRAFVCHRCNALENLGVQGRRKVMSAPDFTEELKALKEQRCVVALVVDVTDFPGSMVYDLPGLISMNNKVIIVVNKCDCIRLRSFNYRGNDPGVGRRLTPEAHIIKWVTEMAVQFGLPRHQIEDVIPISAKRGWNIEKLLMAIESAANLNLQRPHKPLKTYFVGVANVGKSSVINAVAHHLYIPQPPHPKSTKLYYAVTGKDGKESVRWRWYTPPNVNQAEMRDIPAHHTHEASKLVTVSSLPGTTVKTNAVRIKLSGGPTPEATFFYDTPGLFPHWHQTSPLTLHQMRRTLMRQYRNPTCYVLLPGHTLLLGGLAAIDIVKGTPQGLLLMVYTSPKVKSAIISTEKSDAFWRENLGTNLDPPGSLEQLNGATLSESKSYLFECFGKHRMRPKADIYVCGLGWVAFCVGSQSDVVIRVRTLPGVVHGVREPLRTRDLRGWKRWPKLTNKFRSITDHKASVDRVIRLTAKELSPDAVNHDPMTLISKTPQPKDQAAAAEPFAEVLSELEHAGKV